jgi:SNF2 family DNA or RNA helicase
MLQRSDLRPYQNRLIQFGLDQPGAMECVDMGLGKTVGKLTVFADLLASFESRRMLVTAPLRVARKVWKDEKNSWEHLQHLTVATITGTVEERMRALRTAADIHTINVENLAWLEAQFFNDSGQQLRKWPWDVLAMDESQLMKSQSSLRWQVMNRLRPRFARAYCLSGTPMPNGLGDLWSQYKLLDNGRRLGGTEKAFHDRWFTSVQQDAFTKWIPRDTAKMEIEALVADITIALREQDYLSLPPTAYNFIRVQMNKAQRAKYDEMAAKFITELNGKVITAVNSAVVQGKLLQLANGAVYDEERAWHKLHDEKLDALLETIDGLPRPVLVGYNFQHDLERIGKALDKGKRNWALLRSDKAFSAWARGEYDVGVLHPASAGHGLNDVYKSGAENLIWFGFTNDLQLYQQLNGRLTGGHRRQGRNVVIHHIVCDDTEDDVVRALLQRKDVSQQDFIDSMAARAR